MARRAPRRRWSAAAAAERGQRDRPLARGSRRPARAWRAGRSIGCARPGSRRARTGRSAGGRGARRGRGRGPAPGSPARAMCSRTRSASAPGRRRRPGGGRATPSPGGDHVAGGLADVGGVNPLTLSDGSIRVEQRLPGPSLAAEAEPVPQRRLDRRRGAARAGRSAWASGYASYKPSIGDPAGVVLHRREQPRQRAWRGSAPSCRSGRCAAPAPGRRRSAPRCRRARRDHLRRGAPGAPGRRTIARRRRAAVGVRAPASAEVRRAGLLLALQEEHQFDAGAAPAAASASSAARSATIGALSSRPSGRTAATRRRSARRAREAARPPSGDGRRAASARTAGSASARGVTGWPS